MHRKSKNKKILGWYYLGNPDLKQLFVNDSVVLDVLPTVECYSKKSTRIGKTVFK